VIIRAANPGKRGEFFLLFSLSLFHVKKGFSWGRKKKKGVTILRKIVGLDVTPYCSY